MPDFRKVFRTGKPVETIPYTAAENAAAEAKVLSHANEGKRHAADRKIDAIKTAAIEAMVSVEIAAIEAMVIDPAITQLEIENYAG